MDSDGFGPPRPNVKGVRENLIHALAEGAGVIVGREHPQLAWDIRAARQRGELVTLLCGIHVEAGQQGVFALKVLALLRADPDAVLVGASAAVALGWRDPEPDEVVEAASRRIQSRPDGYRLTRRRIPADDIVTHAPPDASVAATLPAVRCTSPALTALDLARAGDPGSVDEALRRGVTLSALDGSLRRRRRPGNQALRRLLHDSRDEPWSPAEREAHKALRAKGVSGWRANLPVERTRPGQGLPAMAFLDVGFADLRLGFEIDGYEHHGNRVAFHADREREIDLVLLGWQVVHVSATWVLAHPDTFADHVDEIARQRALLLGVRRT